MKDAPELLRNFAVSATMDLAIATMIGVVIIAIATWVWGNG